MNSTFLRVPCVSSQVIKCGHQWQMVAGLTEGRQDHPPVQAGKWFRTRSEAGTVEEIIDLPGLAPGEERKRAGNPVKSLVQSGFPQTANELVSRNDVQI